MNYDAYKVKNIGDNVYYYNLLFGDYAYDKFLEYLKAYNKNNGEYFICGEYLTNKKEITLKSSKLYLKNKDHFFLYYDASHQKWCDIVYDTIENTMKEYKRYQKLKAFK